MSGNLCTIPIVVFGRGGNFCLSTTVLLNAKRKEDPLASYTFSGDRVLIPQNQMEEKMDEICQLTHANLLQVKDLHRQSHRLPQSSPHHEIILFAPRRCAFLRGPRSRRDRLHLATEQRECSLGILFEDLATRADRPFWRHGHDRDGNAQRVRRLRQDDQGRQARRRYLLLGHGGAECSFPWSHRHRRWWAHYDGACLCRRSRTRRSPESRDLGCQASLQPRGQGLRISCYRKLGIPGLGEQERRRTLGGWSATF